ncbi:MAG: hypothetical protein WKF57_02385 [Nakamurella sp.]
MFGIRRRGNLRRLVEPVRCTCAEHQPAEHQPNDHQPNDHQPVEHRHVPADDGAEHLDSDHVCSAGCVDRCSELGHRLPTTPTSSAVAAPSLPSVGLDGVNDPHCRTDLPPVVLLHGTFATPAGDFGRLAPVLRASGRCVYAVLYGAAFGYGGVGSITDSAHTVGAFLTQVRTTTGAAEVDVVAFSQGALVLRAALQGSVPGGSVRLALLLAPDYHGTSVPIVTKVPAALCPSCAEQVRGSALLRALDAGGELAPGVRYASLLLDDDAWVQPLADQSPRGTADRVRVQLLQDACPDVQVPHSVLPSSPAAVAWTMATLESAGRPAGRFACR